MLKRFLDYVEIKTKITSVFAFLMSLAWLFYQRREINWLLTGVFFLSMFIFDLTTTAINNYVDTKTNEQKLQFPRKTALAIILVMLAVSTALGLYLACATDIVILFTGGVCFLCGVFYTWGPLPISRQPLGELFSGVFYGLLIPFLLLYINEPQGTYLTLALSWQAVNLSVNIAPFVVLLLLSVAPVCATANIMLANNICDIEKDIAVKRYTLPYYLGKNRALLLFSCLSYLPCLAAALLVALRVLPPVFLLFLLIFFPVRKNISVFQKKQEKETTFVCSIKNFVLTMSADVLLIFACRWF